jgi:hypothetical protein
MGHREGSRPRDPFFETICLYREAVVDHSPGLLALGRPGLLALGLEFGPKKV